MAQAFQGKKKEKKQIWKKKNAHKSISQANNRNSRYQNLSIRDT
jgi:hypothetical protein